MPICDEYSGNVTVNSPVGMVPILVMVYSIKVSVSDRASTLIFPEPCKIAFCSLTNRKKLIKFFENSQKIFNYFK